MRSVVSGLIGKSLLRSLTLAQHGQLVVRSGKGYGRLAPHHVASHPGDQARDGGVHRIGCGGGSCGSAPNTRADGTGQRGCY